MKIKRLLSRIEGVRWVTLSPEFIEGSKSVCWLFLIVFILYFKHGLLRQAQDDLNGIEKNGLVLCGIFQILFLL